MLQRLLLKSIFKIEYPLNGNIAEKQMEFNIVNGIHNYFTNMSETLSLIKEIDTYSPLDIEEVFVEPILSEESEYVSESSGKVETICLDELLDDTDNVILFGKKESGKTTILQQIKAVSTVFSETGISDRIKATGVYGIFCRYADR